MTNSAVPGSFRDPSGFLFSRDELLFRQVNQCYRDDYDLLMSSGLYGALVKQKLLIPHEEVTEPPRTDAGYKVLSPERVDFISYPYEWCFSQLKDAALLTLKIQKKALDHGMVLKDCSAYNVQYHHGRPVFIDTLSFARYEEGRPWVAYRQFCQHFLAPLALMSYTDVRLGQLLRNYIDGVPLDLANTLLPRKAKLRPSLAIHISLHAGSQKRYEDKQVNARQQKVSRQGLTGLVDNLHAVVSKLQWKPAGTEWGDYYEDTNYSDDATGAKCELVASFIDQAGPSHVWDLGANTGMFSRIAADRGLHTVAFDIDPAAVEKNYRQMRSTKEQRILPLLLDLTNPSPGLGWGLDERMSFVERGPADTVMALALIHHLAIGNNVPLARTADFFNRLAPNLIIEFVPKSDSQVQRLLASREDVFDDYDQDSFEAAYSVMWDIKRSERVGDSERTLYLMARK